jgi:Fe-S-cluster containining protein
MFIHIRPEETKTLQRIPRQLLFPAPGQPKGHVLMGYTDEGRCPMLVNNECSIYEDRPQTCRDYDCRVLAAAGVAVDPHLQAEIADRIQAWAFDYESDASREEHRIVKEAAAFLQRNRDLFPQGSVPTYPVQLAALAVRIYRHFGELMAQQDASPMADAEIARAIVRECSAPEEPPQARKRCRPRAAAHGNRRRRA